MVGAESLDVPLVDTFVFRTSRGLHIHDHDGALITLGDVAGARGLDEDGAPLLAPEFPDMRDVGDQIYGGGSSDGEVTLQDHSDDDSDASDLFHVEKESDEVLGTETLQDADRRVAHLLAKQMRRHPLLPPEPDP